MKKVILALVTSLAVTCGIKEAGAAACCCSSSMGAGIAEDNKDTGAGGTDCLTLGEMADHDGTRGPRDPQAQRNSEARDGHSGSHQHGLANEAVSPKVPENSR